MLCATFLTMPNTHFHYKHAFFLNLTTCIACLRSGQSMSIQEHCDLYQHVISSLLQITLDYLQRNQPDIILD